MKSVLLNLKFSRRWLTLLPSGSGRRAVRWMPTNIPEKHTASIFRVALLSFACYLFYIFFNPEYRGTTFLLNVGELRPDHTVSHSRSCTFQIAFMKKLRAEYTRIKEMLAAIQFRMLCLLICFKDWNIKTLILSVAFMNVKPGPSH
jgi:hypothetical protein